MQRLKHFFGNSQPAAHSESKVDSEFVVPKVVRDTFSLPPAEYALLEQLRARALALGQVANKSEFVRAGLRALIDMPEPDFRQAIAQVEKIKPGRPKYK
ncbi:hypothetical protein E4P82_19270 [Candidatus Competibacter phosphatis]|uniref:Uncharacterized protein n=1 Tax=Candidatus Competibacter phosphatis TaxID=221280 RepID=A0ABX1TP04_9GAMM|nr:hypothetical protein [Candidatus Competibacter phosphatis]NMQ21147.1 hypothetical protein [Candidatus Competibacter phosphatis]